MPELPEVEIVKQSLNQKIKQKKIKKVIIKNRSLRFKIPPKFEENLKNKIVEKTSRFAKYIILNFHDNSFCLIHLGMTGTIHLIKKNDLNKNTNASFYSYQRLPKKHNHIVIEFKNLKFIYNDPRRFGFFTFISNKKKLTNRFSHLGPEPFSKLFNLDYFSNHLLKRKKNIKSVLLDQKLISGIGNIYANEILFYSKVKPTKNVMKLSVKECKNIIFFSKKVLNEAIKRGGSSIRDFKNTSGVKGSFQKEFRVYQRDGFKCARNNCTGKVKKKFISNRSTFFCNSCQK